MYSHFQLRTADYPKGDFMEEGG